MTYSTFWNDFSHYSVYQDGENEIETPVNYQDMSQGGAIFSDMNDFVTFKSNEMRGQVNYEETSFMNNRILENIHLKG